MILERYRRDYQGEFVVGTTGWRDGIKHQERTWIDSSARDIWTSGRAAVIGSNADRDRFDHTRLERHRGGLQGRRRLQTYGTLDIWRDMRLNFYVTTQQDEIAELLEREYHDITPWMTRRLRYHELTTVYTTASQCLEHPKKLWPIPHGVHLSNLALPLYLAAFDGQTEIYMLGYNQELVGIDKDWRQDILEVMSVYSGVHFILVGTESNMPPEWRRMPNVSAMTHRKFITHCDI